jgi:cyclophilin family peptidyl-prolyl cis-trans isomerase
MEASMLKNLLLLLVICGLAVGPAAAKSNPKVLIKTSKGDMTVELYPDKSPVTVANFLSYVDEKFYDGTIFHRVISDFMIQGGGYTPDFVEKESKSPIKNEANNGLSNIRGTISMARLPEPHTASNQFFINHEDNYGLDYQDPENYGYCVFGKVISGLDVVDAIASVKTKTVDDFRDVPREDIIIISITRTD